jgi:hypothetical protein
LRRFGLSDVISHLELEAAQCPADLLIAKINRMEREWERAVGCEAHTTRISVIGEHTHISFESLTQ